MTCHKAAISKRATLQILPCTVSQLLSASQDGNDAFAFCGWELNQVSVVGIIRGYAPFVTNIQYSVDDMTGPPLNVKEWVNAEDSALIRASPGNYVKVIGSLRSYSGQRSLMAMNIYPIKDLNEITSHMMEVVEAHMKLFGKVFDVNMNATAVSLSGKGGTHPAGVPSAGFSPVHDQVLYVIRRFSVSSEGIGFHDLKAQLHCLSMKDLRESLGFLVREGHIFTTIDDYHFKSTYH